jgi:hypothetical protein
MRAAENESIILFPEEASIHINKYNLAMKELEMENITESEKILNNILKTVRCHFESYNSLIDIALGQNNYSKTLKLFNQGEKDVNLILEMLTPENNICWKYGSNRDFLGFVYNVGVRALNAGTPLKAKEVFNTLLRLNPSDEQDVREILIDTLFELKDYQAITDISRNYNNDKNPSMIFNEILSLYLLGKFEEAKNLICNLNAENMRVYKKLNDKNSFFQEESHKYIPFNSLKNKFLYYWENFGEYWNSAEGALEFLHLNVPNIHIEESEEPTVVHDLKVCNIEDFEENLKEKGFKEATVKEHLDNIAIFKELLSSRENIKEKLVTIFKDGVTKSRLNKLITTLNQYFRFSIEDKEFLKEILGEFRNLKDSLLSSMEQ